MSDTAVQPHVRFWFDPVCPFAWMTSKWVRMVAEQRGHEVEWRFISLRLLNAHVDYDSHFPPEYEAGHTSGLHLLRVCARARDEHGPDAVASSAGSPASSSAAPSSSWARSPAGIPPPPSPGSTSKMRELMAG